jgi:hypothetical protein
MPIYRVTRAEQPTAAPTLFVSAKTAEVAKRTACSGCFSDYLPKVPMDSTQISVVSLNSRDGQIGNDGHNR